MTVQKRWQHLRKRRNTPTTRRRFFTVLLGLMALLLLLAGCSREGSRAPNQSESVTARFVITGLPEPGGEEGKARFEGLGDFTKHQIKYALMSPSGKSLAERMEFEDITYSTWAGEEEWSKSQDEPGLYARVLVRDKLVSSPEPLAYLRSVANDVTDHGVERVRGEKTRHYSGTIDLAAEGGTKGRMFPVNIWIDDSNRIVRYEFYQGVGPEIFRWEFFDYGVPVNLTPPPPEKTLECHPDALGTGRRLELRVRSMRPSLLPHAAVTSTLWSRCSILTSCFEPIRRRCIWAHRGRFVVPRGWPHTFSGCARFAQCGARERNARSSVSSGRRPRVVFAFTINRGKIVEIDSLADPDRLSKLDLTVLQD